MSDPTGTGTTPEQPSFSGPQGYASIPKVESFTLTEKERLAAKEERKNFRKGQSVGTFQHYEITPKQPLQNFPRKVGGEVRNPETEELIRLGRLAKNEGFIFTVNAEGQVEAEIPKEYLTEEEELRQKLEEQRRNTEQKTEEARLLKELLPLSLLYTENKKDAEILRSRLQNPATVAVIDNLSAELDGLISETHAKPEEGRLNEIRKKLGDFEQAVQTARDEFAQLPPSTPAPTAAPTPEPLREYGGWPTYDVYFRKQTKGTPGGWFSRDNPSAPLPDPEMWDSEYKAFELAYKRYTDFLRPLKLADRQLLKPLIDARARVIEAVKAKDVMRVAATREEFEATLEDWQKRWEKLGKLKESEKKFSDVKKASEGVLTNVGDQTEAANISAKQNEIGDQLKKGRDAILAGGDVDFDKLSRLIDGYNAIIGRYKATQDALSLQTKMGRAVLRPIIATEKNKNQKIKTIDGREITVAERAAELAQEKRDADVVELSGQDIATWPELLNSNYKLGDKVEKKWFQDFQTLTKYVRALERDENGFLSLYVKPEEDPTTHGIRYVATENLRRHPEKKMIMKVLREIKGVVVTDPTYVARTAQDNAAKESESLSVRKFGSVYNPIKDMQVNRGPFGKSMPKENKTKLSNFGGMETRMTWAKRAAKDITLEPGKVSGPMALDLEHNPVVAKSLTEKQLSPEENEKRRETLKKIDEITKARENWFAKKEKKEKAPWWSLWAPLITAVIVGVGGGAGIPGSAERGFGTPEQPAATGKASPETEKNKLEIKEEWRGFLNPENKSLVDDVKNLTFEQFAKKNAKDMINIENPAAIGELGAMDGYKVLNSPEPCYGLGDDQRGKLCNLFRRLENISQATDVPRQHATEAKGELFNPPSDQWMTPTVTAEQYFNLLKKKIARADAEKGNTL